MTTTPNQLRSASRRVRRALWRHVGRFLASDRDHGARPARRMSYLVVWQIFVEAQSAEGAAAEAYAAQQNVDSDATVFQVCDERESWTTVVCKNGVAAGVASDVGGPMRRHLSLVRSRA